MGKNQHKESILVMITNVYHITLKGNANENSIDDITWNDLGMDDIFRMMNNTNSSAGQEYLYRMLRQPDADMESLKKS